LYLVRSSLLCWLSWRYVHLTVKYNVLITDFKGAIYHNVGAKCFPNDTTVLKVCRISLNVSKLWQLNCKAVLRSHYKGKDEKLKKWGRRLQCTLSLVEHTCIIYINLIKRVTRGNQAISASLVVIQWMKSLGWVNFTWGENACIKNRKTGGKTAWTPKHACSLLFFFTCICWLNAFKPYPASSIDCPSNLIIPCGYPLQF